MIQYIISAPKVFDKMQNHSSRARADRPVDWIERSAVGASFVCLVHCLALPFLLAALPALASVMPVSERFHLWVIAFAVPTSTIALWTGRARHGSQVPGVIGAAGLALLVLGAVVFGETRWETPITVCGSLTLAVAHLRNWRLRHQALHATG